MKFIDDALKLSLRFVRGEKLIAVASDRGNTVYTKGVALEVKFSFVKRFAICTHAPFPSRVNKLEMSRHTYEVYSVKWLIYTHVRTVYCMVGLTITFESVRNFRKYTLLEIGDFGRTVDFVLCPAVITSPAMVHYDTI